MFILTRHHQHAPQVIKALRAGKHVFVEKPLAISVDEIEQIEETLAAAEDPKPLLFVGFNRRFSPAAMHVKRFFESVTTPLTISIRFNAGHIPADHWTHDPEDGAIGVTDHDAEIPTSREIADVVHVVGPILHHNWRILRDASGTVAKLAPAIVSPAIHVSIAAVREAMSRPRRNRIDRAVWANADRRRQRD